MHVGFDRLKRIGTAGGVRCLGLGKAMIATRRLVLRPWSHEDLPALDAILGDANVMEFSERGPLGKDDQIAWLDRAVAPREPEALLGTLAIAHRTDGRVIGYISLDRDLERVSHHESELGFRLAQPAWGTGYATEAALAILDAAKALPGITHVVALVDPHNHRSLNVLKKIGMTHERDILLPGYDYPDHVYVRALSGHSKEPSP